MTLNNFTLDEFDSPDKIGSGNNMQEDFLKKLDKAREIADIPFIITSGFRTQEHNKKVGGVDSSSHTKGWAADISCRESRNRFIIVKALIEAGFTRIGVARTFIHVDSDPDKAPKVIWKY